MSDQQKIELVETSRIVVPQQRITSVWEPETEKEFQESIRANGIKEPVRILDVDGTLYLIDGLHRLQEAERQDIKQIPAIIEKGTIENLLIDNLIFNRQRGKSNPAQEAEVLRYLTEQRGFPLETACKQIGISPDWARKLLKISSLPEQIKDLIKTGSLPVSGAIYIADLENPTEQINVARDATTYQYTAYQIKARVSQILNPDVDPDQGEVTFTPNGKPTRVPIRCTFCGEELPNVGKAYIWVCPQCEDLIHNLYKSYNEALKRLPSP